MREGEPIQLIANCYITDDLHCKFTLIWGYLGYWIRVGPPYGFCRTVTLRPSPQYLRHTSPICHVFKQSSPYLSASSTVAATAKICSAPLPSLQAPARIQFQFPGQQKGMIQFANLSKKLAEKNPTQIKCNIIIQERQRNLCDFEHLRTAACL